MVLALENGNSDFPIILCHMLQIESPETKVNKKGENKKKAQRPIRQFIFFRDLLEQEKDKFFESDNGEIGTIKKENEENKDSIPTKRVKSNFVLFCLLKLLCGNEFNKKISF